VKELAVLFSGGTDSTCATALLAGEYDRVHLITYSRFGLFHMEHAAKNVAFLRKRFGEDRFIHTVIAVDRIFKEISYSCYWRMFARYGLFLLSTCGLCRLSMHVRTIIYCRTHGITRVIDGANRHAAGGISTDQSPSVIEGIRKMYSRYGIEYTAPVYDFDEAPGNSWADKLHVQAPQLRSIIADAPAPAEGRTTGKILYEMGFSASTNLKGTKTDRRMQARCLQLILSNIFIYGWYLGGHTKDEFLSTLGRFMGEKLDHCCGLIDGYINGGDSSRLARLLENESPGACCVKSKGNCKGCLVKLVFPDH
jgi:7-cyano-7-deazaguanine synthase in queuosine biosynthesis